MNCAEFRETAACRPGVREWLALACHASRCPRCRGMMAEARDLREALRDLPRPDPPPELHERLVTATLATHETDERPARTGPRRRTGLGRVVACVLLGVVAAITLAAPERVALYGVALEFRLDGHSWKIRSSYAGEVAVADANGGDVGHRLGPSWPPLGLQEVQVDVDGRRVFLTKPGRHGIMGPSESVVGYVTLLGTRASGLPGSGRTPSAVPQPGQPGFEWR